MEGLTNSTITGATVFCLCLSTACARCWSIRRPSTTSDCRRCDSGFLGEFRQGILTDERKLTRRKSVRAEAGPWTLFGRTILQYGDCRAEEGRFCHPVTNETRCDTESRVRDVLPSDSERPSRKCPGGPPSAKYGPSLVALGPGTPVETTVSDCLQGSEYFRTSWGVPIAEVYWSLPEAPRLV